MVPSAPRTRLPVGLEALSATMVDTAGVAVCAWAVTPARLNAAKIRILLIKQLLPSALEAVRMKGIGKVSPGSGMAGQTYEPRIVPHSGQLRLPGYAGLP